MQRVEEYEYPLVTIVCTVFNHEKYLKEAIEGFLMQKCKFKFNVFIQDDCSTDNSKQIIQEYEMKYPDIIRGYYLHENIYSQGISPLFNLIEKVKTKYIAICEGDDFWIDKYKLQKQIDFLENNSNYSATYHNIIVVDDDSNVLDSKKKLFPLYKEHNFTLNDIQKTSACCSQSASLVFVNFWRTWGEKNKEKFLQCSANGDIKLNLILVLLGKVKFMEDIMSCYRKSLTNDSWSAKVKGQNLMIFYHKSRKSMELMVKELFNIEIHFDTTRYTIGALSLFIKDHTYSNLKILLTSIRMTGVLKVLRELIVILRNKVHKHKTNTYWELSSKVDFEDE